MRTKDFGFFQQHVEKIVLGLGLLVLLGVGATQFLLGEPNAVELENKSVAPGDIKDTVVIKAERLKNDLGKESPIPEIVIPKYAESFVRLFGLPVATDQSLAAIDAPGIASVWLNVVSPKYLDLLLPTPPVPIDVLATSGHGVLDDGGDRAFAFRQIIGDQRPADFSYVSVSAEFSFDELTKRYRAEDVPQNQRIDEGLWRERMAITSVRLLREELNVLTGEWGDKKTITPLPGQIAVVPEDRPELSFEQSQELESWIRQNQPDIRRPIFPQIANGPWNPPGVDDRKFTPEQLQRREELERIISTAQRRIDRLSGNEGRDDGRGNRSRPDRRQNDFDDLGGIPDDLGGGGGRGGRPDRSARGGGRDRGTDRGNNERPDRESQQLMKAEEELYEAQRELNELLGIDEEDLAAENRNRLPGGGDFDGFDPIEMMNPEDFAVPGAGAVPGGYGNLPRRTGSQTEDVPEAVKVWAHDLTVEPGKTYRYKVLVSVLNPLYRFPRLNPEQKKNNENRISIGPSQDEIDNTPWSISAEVTLDPLHYFFVTSGNKDAKRADFEVWTVFNGIWRNKEFVEFPGNEVGGNAEFPNVDTGGRPVAMNVGAIMLDVDSIKVANGSPAVRVLLLDPATNRIETRLVNDDKNSDKRRELDLEAELQQKKADNRLSARQ